MYEPLWWFVASILCHYEWLPECQGFLLSGPSIHLQDTEVVRTNSFQCCTIHTFLLLGLVQLGCGLPCFLKTWFHIRYVLRILFSDWYPKWLPSWLCSNTTTVACKSCFCIGERYMHFDIPNVRLRDDFIIEIWKHKFIVSTQGHKRF